MSLNIPMKSIKLPQSDFASAPHLMGFDYGEHLFHVLGFDFGDDGGAIGIWREGSKFCARISLDTLAEFWDSARRGDEATAQPGRALHGAALAIIEGLMSEELPEESPEGVAFKRLAVAVEAYEKATLLPPFGDAAPAQQAEQSGARPMEAVELTEAEIQHIKNEWFNSSISFEDFCAGVACGIRAFAAKNGISLRSSASGNGEVKP